MKHKESNKEWVLALHREVCEIFQEHKLKLGRPTIFLSDSETEWGRWDPLHQSISISKHLIEKCSWRIVVEVLKHEIAHQLNDSLHAGKSVKPHGKEFLKICQALRMESWAQSASFGRNIRDLKAQGDWHKQDEDAKVSRAQRRIQKLIALANSSSNEHEALLAMQRLRELQKKHTSEHPKSILDDCVHWEIGSGRQRHPPYESQVASLLMSHFRVDIVFISRFNSKRCRPEAIIDVLGRREDVLLAEHVHAFIHQSCESLWKQERKVRSNTGLRSRNSFMRGLLAGFHRKLDEQDTVTQSTPQTRDSKKEQGLLISTGLARQKYLQTRYPRLRTHKSRARVEAGAYESGKEAGRNLTLRNAIQSEPLKLHLLSS